MSTCQDICLISVWGLEDWNPHYGHHQLFPSSLQVWRDSFEMRNIKADLTELLRWCINSSHLAKSTITITVGSIIHSKLATGAVSEAFPHILLLHGRQQGEALAVTFGWDWWGRGAGLNEAGHPLCPAQTCYKSVPSSWSGLLSTKEPLTRTERKLNIEVRVSGRSEHVCALVKSWRIHLYACWLWDTEEEGWASITALFRNLSLLKPFALVAI